MARVFLHHHHPATPTLPDDLCVISCDTERMSAPIYLRWGRYVKEFHVVVKALPWRERRFVEQMGQWEIGHRHLAVLVTEARKHYPHVRVVIGSKRDDYIWEGFEAAA